MSRGREEEIEERKGVEAFRVDMWEGFAKVIRRVFHNTGIVYDRFDVMQQVNREFNKMLRLGK